MGEEKTLNTDKQLRRELTLIDLVSLALGGIIGSAWLFSALSAASIAGPSAVLSWVIGGILIIFIGLAYAELGTAVPRSGGIVRYPHYSHGSYAGYMLAVLYLISAVTTPSIEAEAVVEYLASISPLNFLTTSVNGVNVLTVYGILLAICLMVVFFLVNYFGIKALGKTNTGITIWKLVVPTVTFILLFFAFNSKNFTSYGFLPTGNSNGLIDVFYAIPASGIVYAYLGFRQPVEYAGEAKNPQRDIGRAIVISLAIAIIIYTLLQIAFIGALDWTSAGISTPGNWTALTSSSWASGPFYNELENSGKALGLALLVYWGYALLVDAVISPSGTGLVYIGTTTRTFYGIAADRYFPEFFLRLNKYKIPIFSLIATLVVGILFLLPFPSWYLFVNFSSLATVFTYVMGGIGLQTLRRTAPDLRRPVKLAGSKVIAPIATVSAMLVAYWSGFTTIFYVLTSLFILVPIFWIYYAVKELNMNRALGVTLGLLQLLSNILLAYFAYVNILNSSYNLIGSFIMYFLGFLGMSIIPSLIGYLAVNETGRKYIKSGLWLIGLILATYVMSFIGNFGLLSSPIVPFPYDTILVVIIGLVFHYLAVYSGFRTEEIENIVREQAQQD